MKYKNEGESIHHSNLDDDSSLKLPSKSQHQQFPAKMDFLVSSYKAFSSFNSLILLAELMLVFARPHRVKSECQMFKIKKTKCSSGATNSDMFSITFTSIYMTYGSMYNVYEGIIWLQKL